MNYNDILEDAVEFRQRFVLVNVCLKIQKTDEYLMAVECDLLDIMGRGNDDLMKEAFEDCELNEYFKEEGIYYADVLLNFIGSDGTQADYYIIEAMTNIGSGVCSGCEGQHQFIEECPICMITDSDEFDFFKNTKA